MRFLKLMFLVFISLSLVSCIRDKGIKSAEVIETEKRDKLLGEMYKKYPEFFPDTFVAYTGGWRDFYGLFKRAVCVEYDDGFKYTVYNGTDDIECYNYSVVLLGFNGKDFAIPFDLEKMDAFHGTEYELSQVAKAVQEMTPDTFGRYLNSVRLQNAASVIDNIFINTGKYEHLFGLDDFIIFDAYSNFYLNRKRTKPTKEEIQKSKKDIEDYNNLKEQIRDSIFHFSNVHDNLYKDEYRCFVGPDGMKESLRDGLVLNVSNKKYLVYRTWDANLILVSIDSSGVKIRESSPASTPGSICF